MCSMKLTRVTPDRCLSRSSTGLDNDGNGESGNIRSAGFVEASPAFASFLNLGLRSLPLAISPGKVDCADPNCKDDPACLNLQPLCRRNPGCTALGLNTGSCCPTPSNQYLACCAVGSTKSEKGLCSDGVDNDGDGKIDCSDSECKNENVCIFKGLNPMCSRNKNCTGLSGLCCPTVDGVYLDCCRGSL